ncbi:MAG: DUF222 domain-containing protein [Ilumatobacteraceae bacterium]
MSVSQAFADVDFAPIASSFDSVFERTFEAWSVQSLEYEICSWAANMTAADARWLRMIAEFDRQQGWARHGSVSCAKWLQARVGLDRSTAHEKVRVAHALEQFPLFAVAMSAGVLSYAKVRSITRIATAGNADMLLTMALERSSNQVERYVASFRRCEVSEDELEARAFAERSLSYRTEDASMVITIRVPVEAGAAFIASVDRFVNTAERDTPQTARRADAAIDMAEHAVANIDHAGSFDGQYLVTLHLTPEVFADREAESDRASDRHDVCCVAPGDGVDAHPAAVSRMTAERILCDAVMHGSRIDGAEDGLLGANRRFPSAKLQRALRLRDGGCMAPGCDRLGWLHSHHITHWTQGGPTIASNLVSLCRFHHRLVHEGGWRITGDANIGGRLTFHRPDGTTLANGEELLVGHAKFIDIGCTADAVRPGASVQEQLESIADRRRINERCCGLGRKRRAAFSRPGATAGTEWPDRVDLAVRGGR